MLARLCGCEWKSTQIYSLSSHSLPILKDLWRQKTFLMYSIRCKDGKKENEGIFPSLLRKKLNWKFSIIYIWGKLFHLQRLILSSPTNTLYNKVCFQKTSRWRKVLCDEDGALEMRSGGWKGMTILCCNKFSQYIKKKSILPHKKLRSSKARLFSRIWKAVMLSKLTFSWFIQQELSSIFSKKAMRI